jgi:TRAP-type mannitol/chloroaromatic compound transport system permease large subunit
MAELMAILLFISICVALMAGYPVAFTLGGVSLLFVSACSPAPSMAAT